MVTSQPSLAQLLEALRPIQAPIVGPAPAVPPPINIPGVVADEKDEVGPEQLVRQDKQLVVYSEPLVDNASRVKESISSSSSSSSSAVASSSSYITREHLEKMSVNRGQTGVPSLYQYATSLNITIPKYMPNTDKQRPTKEFIIDLLLRKTQPLPSHIPRPRTK
jgi:hypothetical protein